MIIYEDILRAFQKNRVKYVLVGGLAVNLQGAFRSTADQENGEQVDLIIDSPVKFAQAIKEADI